MMKYIDRIVANTRFLPIWLHIRNAKGAWFNVVHDSVKDILFYRLDFITKEKPSEMIIGDSLLLMLDINDYLDSGIFENHDKDLVLAKEEMLAKAGIGDQDTKIWFSLSEIISCDHRETIEINRPILNKEEGRRKLPRRESNRTSKSEIKNMLN